MDNKEDYISPDLTEYPREDDDFLEEIDEGEILQEKLLDEQFSQSKEEPRMIEPSPWSPQQSNQPKPWETTKPTGSSSGGWGTDWNKGNSWGSSWSSSSNQATIPTQNNTPGYDTRALRHRAVIVDVLDCLYEPWDAAGVPNKLPRAIFDLKPKFEVWEKLQVFSPTRLYVIYPPTETIPSLGNPEANGICQDWISCCLGTYLRLPRSDVKVYQQMVQGVPKESLVELMKKDWIGYGRIEEMIYVGARSGLYDLGSRDIEVAQNCRLHFMNVYNLMQGRYIVE